jgi:hypothetical protein
MTLLLRHTCKVNPRNNTHLPIYKPFLSISPIADYSFERRNRTSSGRNRTSGGRNSTSGGRNNLRKRSNDVIANIKNALELNDEFYSIINRKQAIV